MHVPHQFAQWLVERISRIVAPARPDDLLDPVEFARRADDVRRISRTVNWIQGLYGLGMSIVAIMTLMAIDRALIPPPRNPVFDNHTYVAIATSVVFGVMSGFGIALLTWESVAARVSDIDRDLYHRWKSTEKSVSERRRTLFFAWFSLVLGVFVFGLSLTLAEILDERGFRVSGFPTGTLHPFSDIREISMYDDPLAPIGARHVPNIEVRFQSGDPFRRVAETAQMNDKIEKIAQFCSEKSGVPIKRGGRRPD